MSGKIISIVNRKGGVGKTTLAIAIADAFISEHRTHTCIVDLDPQSTASRALLDEEEFFTRVDNNRNLYGLLEARLNGGAPNVDDYRRGMLHFIRARGDIDLRLYPNSDRFWDLEANELAQDNGARLSKAIERILAEEASDDRVVIVDCPPGQTVSASAAIRSSNLVICPITPGRFSLWGKDLLSSYITKNAPNIPLKFVVTRATFFQRVASSVLEELNGAPKMLRVITGQQTPGAGDGLALFSESTKVHDRIHMKRERKLSQIYGTKGSRELTIIVNAIRRELT